MRAAQVHLLPSPTKCRYAILCLMAGDVYSEWYIVLIFLFLIHPYIYHYRIPIDYRNLPFQTTAWCASAWCRRCSRAPCTHSCSSGRPPSLRYGRGQVTIQVEITVVEALNTKGTVGKEIGNWWQLFASYATCTVWYLWMLRGKNYE